MVKLGNAAVAHGAVFGPNGLPYLRGKTNDTSLALSVLLEVTVCLGAKNKQTKEFYQTGAAEYAQIQAARLCKLHNCLGRVKKKRKTKENENPGNSSLALQHKTELRRNAHTGSLADSQ